MELLYTILIPNYPRKVLLTKSKRAKYYKPIDKLAKKYLGELVVLPTTAPFGRGKDNQGYYLNKDFFWNNNRLHNVITKEDIIKNPSQIGKEVWEVINGQKIIQQVYHEFTRKKIFDFLTAFFIKELERIKKDIVIKEKHYPLSIHYHYHCNIPDNADLDNYSLPYHKVVQDCLTKIGIIVNDTIKHINGIKITHTPTITNEVADWGKEIIETLTVKIYANTV